MSVWWAWTFSVATIAFFCANSVDAELLYTDEDDVVLLNASSFNRTVLDTPNAWLVEFFSNWCGHCVRYAPLYKQLATDIKGTACCLLVVNRKVVTGTRIFWRVMLKADRTTAEAFLWGKVSK